MPVNLRGACYPVKRARFSAPERSGATRRESTPRPGAHPEGTRELDTRESLPSARHLDRSPGSLIRESRIFGQIGSFSAGMARRTPVGPVRHLCRWVSRGRYPRECAVGKGGKRGGGREGRGIAARGRRFPREEGRERVGGVSRPRASDWFPNFAGAAVDETRRDATRRRTSPRLDRRAPTGVTQALSTIRRRLGANRRACRRRGCVSAFSDVRGEVAERTLSSTGRVSAPRGGSDRGSWVSHSVSWVLVSSRFSGLAEATLSIMLYAITMMSRVLAVGHESFIRFFCVIVRRSAERTARVKWSLWTPFLKGFRDSDISLTIMSGWAPYGVSTSRRVGMTCPISGSTYFSTWRESLGLPWIRRLCEDEDPYSHGKAASGRMARDRVWEGSESRGGANRRMYRKFRVENA